MTLDELAEKIIDQKIVGLSVDFKTETVTIEIENYDLDITGGGISMKLFELNKNNLH